MKTFKKMASLLCATAILASCATFGVSATVWGNGKARTGLWGSCYSYTTGYASSTAPYGGVNYTLRCKQWDVRERREVEEKTAFKTHYNYVDATLHPDPYTYFCYCYHYGWCNGVYFDEFID